MQRLHWALGVALIASAAVGCQLEKTANPLSPIVAGPIAGVIISQPNPLEPGQDWQIRLRDQPVKLMIRNAGTSGVRPLAYTFEIATDAAFASIIFKRTGIAPGEEVTTLQLPDALPTGRTYWWRSRAEDGANVGEYSTAIRFVAVTPVVLAAPVPTSPVGTIPVVTPEFKMSEGAKSGPHERIVYTVQVANDASFGSIAALFITDEQGRETIIAQNYSFLNDHQYYWRVQSKDLGDSMAVSPWSATRTFTTALPASIPAPPGGGGGGGGVPGGPCGPPFQSDPLGILQCHRSRYPEHMSHSQVIAYLRGSAQDINRAGIEGGGWGILQKRSGNNCNGYSCDIVCKGQGTSQIQRDVLIDEKYPIWGGAMTYAGGIRVDVCEVQ